MSSWERVGQGGCRISYRIHGRTCPSQGLLPGSKDLIEEIITIDVKSESRSSGSITKIMYCEGVKVIIQIRMGGIAFRSVEFTVKLFESADIFVSFTFGS